VMPTALQANRAKARLDLTRTSRLHTAALLTAPAACRDRPCVGVEPGRSQLQNGFQQGRRCRPPRPEHTFFVISQTVITMCSRVLQQTSAEFQQRLYDLIREDLEVHVAFPDPPLLPTPAGLFV